MKTFFTVLGLIIAVSFAGLFLSTIGLMFTGWQSALYLLEGFFLALCASSGTFIVTLVAIPHGKIKPMQK